MNPGCRDEGGAGMWVIQHTEPAIIEVNIDTPAEGAPVLLVKYRNSDGVEEPWYLSLQYASAGVANHEHLLKRAARWWVAYLNEEDERIDEADDATLN